MRSYFSLMYIFFPHVLLDIYVRSIFYAYVSKELYIFCSFKVMRYKPRWFGMVLLLLRVLLLCCLAAAPAAALPQLACVYSDGHDFSDGCDYTRF